MKGLNPLDYRKVFLLNYIGLFYLPYLTISSYQCLPCDRATLITEFQFQLKLKFLENLEEMFSLEEM